MIRKVLNIRYRLAGLLLASFFILQGCGSGTENPDDISIDITADFSYITVRGTSNIPKNRLAERFQVFLLSDSGTVRADQAPLLGEHFKQKNAILFSPAFSLSRGQSYRARYYTGNQWLERDFYIPGASAQPLAQIEQVHPTPDALPLNLLKFYIQFTDSMARGFAYENIHFLAANGDTIPDVYLELSEELWSPDMKRFTLLLDPGRIKRGLGSKIELGYAFEQGLSYQLVINKNWRDAHNQPMTRGFTKSFSITEELRSLAGSFQLTDRPASGTRDILTLTSPITHDYALLHSAIQVTDINGHVVNGSIELKQNEKVWQFTPATSWESKTYQIRIGNFLEDIAGNNVINLFDVDNTVAQTTPASASKAYKTLDFIPR